MTTYIIFMKYFILNSSINNKIIGVYPQVQTSVIPTTVDDPNFISHLLFEEANGNILLTKPILSNKGKKTDLLSTSSAGMTGRLLVSEKLNHILLDSESSGVQHLKTKLINGGHEEDYWILNPYYASFKFFDFENSLFSYMDAMCNIEIEKVIFQNSEEFAKAYFDNRISATKNKYPDHKPLLITKLAINNNCVLDFFPITPIKPGGIVFIVSEYLKNKIELANCTGTDFKEII